MHVMLVLAAALAVATVDGFRGAFRSHADRRTRAVTSMLGFEYDVAIVGRGCLASCLIVAPQVGCGVGGHGAALHARAMGCSAAQRLDDSCCVDDASRLHIG